MKHSNVKGFTLIELLVVMVISGIVMSLVGGLATQQLDNFETLKQRERMLRLLSDTENKAFVLHQTLRIYVAGSRMRVMLAGYHETDTIYSKTFDNLTFPSAEYEVNGNGFWNQSQFRWQEGNRERTTPL